MKPKRGEFVAMQITLPYKVRLKLQRLAKAERRSMKEHVAWLVEQYVKDAKEPK
jgi:predicted transcriptional regulator